MIAFPKSLQSILLAACAMLGGCISIGRDAKPEFPPAIEPHVYDARIAETKHLAQRNRPMMAIGGARIADGGIYLDLLLVNVPRTDGVEPREVGTGLGDFFSDLEEPSTLIEIQDEFDQPVQLNAMQRPRMGGIIMPGTCILYPRAMQYLAEASDELAYVDVCIWRTKRQLKPGTYHIRLLSQQSNGGEQSRMARIAEFYDIDTNWRTLNVEVVPRLPDS